MSWRFAVLNRWEDVWAAPNLAAWQAAYAPGSGAHVTPYMHPDFVRAWLASIGGAATYRPLHLEAVHRSGQRLRWLFVIATSGWRQGGLRELVPVGSAVPPFGSGAQVGAYFEPIIGRALPAPGPRVAPGFWEAFVAEMRKLEGIAFDICRIARFRAEILGAPAGAEPYGAAPFLDLSGYRDIESYLAARRPKVRSTIRRRLRRMAEAGSVALRIHAPHEVDEIAAWLPKLAAARQQRHGIKGHPGDFCLNMVRAAVDSGLCHCSTLLVDGRAVSWKFGYLIGGTYDGYYRGFDPALAQFSPGQVHFYLLLERLIEQGVGRVDFGVGSQDYKYEWTDGAEWSLLSFTQLSQHPASVARRSMASTVERVRQLARGRSGAAEPVPAEARAVAPAARKVD